MSIKSIAGITLATIMIAGTGYGQTWKDIVNKGKTVIEKNKTTTSTGSFTNTEAVNALKEALKIGTNNASGKLSTLNGYFSNQLIKIAMPPEARKVESAMRAAGMGSYVDKAILSMNRAAEDAATKAVPIFTNAITSMTITDGISIVRGGNNSATEYLKGRTTQSLTTAFRPVIQTSLNKVNATKYWADVFNIYNRLPTTRTKINPDLAGYVTEKALNGLFVTIADEENKIRSNPGARVTELLRKVFGAK
jgi:hypothetical protein